MMYSIFLIAVMGQSPATAFSADEPKPITQGMERMDGLEKTILSRIADKHAERLKKASNRARRIGVQHKLKSEFHYFKWFTLPYTDDELSFIEQEANRACEHWDHDLPAPEPKQSQNGVIPLRDESAPPFDRNWHIVTMPDGTARYIWGWVVADGQIGWNESEQPQPRTVMTTVLITQHYQVCPGGKLCRLR